MSTDQVSQYSSVDDLLSDRAEAMHDIQIGRHKVQVVLPVTYFESFSLEEDTANWLKEMKKGECPPELKPFIKRKPAELVAAYTLHRLMASPQLSLLQALKMLDDGIKVKAIIATIESLRIHHLREHAVEAVEAGKED